MWPTDTGIRPPGPAATFASDFATGSREIRLYETNATPVYLLLQDGSDLLRAGMIADVQLPAPISR